MDSDVERPVDLSEFGADNGTAAFRSEFQQNHPNLAFVFVILMNFSGLIVHGYIMHRILFRKVFGRLFGWLWIFREATTLACCAMDVFAYVPQNFTSRILLESTLGQVITQTGIIFLVEVMLANLLIASNRCLLIRKPLQFKRIFTPKKTLVIIAVSAILPPVVIYSSYVFPFCNLEIDGEVVPICFFFQVLVAILFAYCILFITLVIDMYAIWKLRQMSKIRSEVLSNQLSPRSKRKQMNLCYMIIFQSIVAVPGSLMEIVFESIFWNIALTLDGLIIVYFNDDLRPWKKVLRSENNGGRLHRVNTSGSICTTVIDEII